VLAKGSLTSKTSGEGDIRKALVEARLIDCIVNLPAKLFLNTQIPASLWFVSRNRGKDAQSGVSRFRDRKDEVLFIDARNMGHLINRRTRELSEEDIQKIAGTYHNWRNAPRPPKGGDKGPSVLHSSNPALYNKLEERAKAMRANPTEAEKLLWEKLRNKQLGVKFRQQHVINKFIVDFCSIQSALIIEIDGKIHDRQGEEDTDRTKILEKEGYTVIRFSNDEILSDIEKVISIIKNQSKKSPSGDLGAYEDIPGFCKSASIDRVRELDYVLTPGRYVGLPDEEDDFDFNERFTQLQAELKEQMLEEERLNVLILENLKKLKLNEDSITKE